MPSYSGFSATLCTQSNPKVVGADATFCVCALWFCAPVLQPRTDKHTAQMQSIWNGNLHIAPPVDPVNIAHISKRPGAGRPLIKAMGVSLGKPPRWNEQAARPEPPDVTSASQLNALACT